MPISESPFEPCLGPLASAFADRFLADTDFCNPFSCAEDLAASVAVGFRRAERLAARAIMPGDDDAFEWKSAGAFCGRAGMLYVLLRHRTPAALPSLSGQTVQAGVDR